MGRELVGVVFRRTLGEDLFVERDIPRGIASTLPCLRHVTVAHSTCGIVGRAATFYFGSSAAWSGIRERRMLNVLTESDYRVVFALRVGSAAFRVIWSRPRAYAGRIVICEVLNLHTIEAALVLGSKLRSQGRAA